MVGMQRVRRIGGLFLRADDPAALSRWYAERLGVDAVQHGNGVVLGAARPKSGACFEVDDLDAMVEQLRAAGVEVDVDPSWHPEGRFAVLRDPDGNAVQLRQPDDSTYVHTVAEEEYDERPARRLPAQWGSPRQWGSSRRGRLALGLGVLIAVVLAVVVTQRADEPSAAPEEPPPPDTATAKPATTTSNPEPEVIQATRLAEVGGDWELFAYGPGELMRVEFATGRMTRTRVPDLVSEGPVTLVVLSDRAIVHQWEGGGGYEVKDGKRALDQRDDMAESQFIAPGPEPDQVWLTMQVDEGRRSVNSLATKTIVGGDMRPAESLPPTFWPDGPDGRGNVIVGGVGGQYLVSPAGMQRITTGSMIAVGPTRYLIETCNQRAHCHNEVIDRDTNARRPLETEYSRADVYALGLVSADGRWAALMRGANSGSPNLELLNLDTGKASVVDVDLEDGDSPGRVVWSPDGRWLVAVSGDDIVLVDPNTGKVRPSGIEHPSVEVVAVRP